MTPFLKRLDDFLEVDIPSRFRVIMVSAVAVVLWGVASDYASSRSFSAAPEAIGIGALVFLIQMFIYCIPLRSHSLTPRAIPLIQRRLVASALTAGVVMFLSVVPAPIAEAAILDRRLRRLTRNSTLSAEDTAGVVDCLQVASARPLKLAKPTLIRVRDAIKTSEINPATGAAGDALAKYNHEIEQPLRVISSGRTEAVRYYMTGAQAYQAAVMNWGATDRAAAKTAIQAFSRAIDMTDNNDLRIDALLGRSNTYLAVGMPTEALADVKRAEQLGALDLSVVVSTEAIALDQLGGRANLEQVVSLTTLGMQFAPPQWMLNADPTDDTLYRAELLSIRASAHYTLRSFGNSESDCRMALILFVPGIMQRTLSPQRLGSLFDHINGILVSSLLRSSRPDEALKAISEWRRMRTDTSALDRVQRAVESFPRDPDAAISELRRFTPVPDLLAE